MSEFPEPVYGDSDTRAIDETPASGLDQPSTVDSPHETVDPDDVTARVDALARMTADLHGKVDHLTNGVAAIYTMVDYLVKMLNAVQQVASMMPGGKRIAQAMAQQHNGGQQ